MIEILSRCTRCNNEEDQQIVVRIEDVIQFICTYCQEEFCKHCEETPRYCDVCMTSDICDGCMDGASICTPCSESEEELEDAVEDQ